MADITIAIDTLALPGIAAADVPMVMAAMEAEVSASLDLARLDPARLVATSVDRLAFDPPAGAPPAELGRLLGQALARQLNGDAP